MGYIPEFRDRIKRRDFPRVLQLWEEYLTVDTTDAEELYEILDMIKGSDFAHSFGAQVESALPMWKSIEDEEQSNRVLKIIFDLETTNNTPLADLAIETLTKWHGDHPQFKEGLRLVGLRDCREFHGCLSNFDLLVHMDKGKFVMHEAGWGTGEIMDISLVREQLSIEFEHVAGIKDFSFKNAFNTLVPLQSNSFLARRFADPDKLEEEARREPVEIIKQILTELGPKNAAELKDELLELVIPEDDWAKWWQGVRARLKKDPLIESPKSIKEPFRLRDEAKSVKEHLQEVLHHKEDLDQFIPILYAFIRDVPNALKEETVREEIKEGLLKALKDEETSLENGLQIALFLEQYLDTQESGFEVKRYVNEIEHLETVLDKISVIALKKRVLEATKKERKDWADLFMTLLSTPQISMIKDYLFTELLGSNERDLVVKRLEEILKNPKMDPETLFWYFQKLLTKADIPFADQEGRLQFLEGLFTLLSAIEQQKEYKDLAKKIYQQISQKRFLVFRQLIEGASRVFLEEILLLASKCHIFPAHDQKILRSLVAVVDDSFKGEEKQQDRLNPDILWTTREGLDRTKERIEQLGSVEVVNNAKEIEEARAHGDLRENSEYKFALERRSRIQEELKRLSTQVSQARIITGDDVECDQVGIGNRVSMTDSNGEAISFTILGPWDANPEDHILSSQSVLAKEMMGKGVGDTIHFKNEDFRVVSIDSVIK